MSERRLWPAIFAVLAACTPAGAPEVAPGAPTRSSQAPPAPKPVVLSIVGTNDVHGELESMPRFAGYLARLRQVRKADGAVVLLDAGDMFQGTLESNLGEGAGVIDVMNRLGYTAAALGNHDFDYGPVGEDSAEGGDPQGALRARLTQARFPILSANLETTSHTLPEWKNLSRSILAEISGVKVGIIGALTEETPSIVLSAYFAGLGVTPLASAATDEARKLRLGGARVVILVAHAGGICESFDDPKDLTKCRNNAEIVRALRSIPPGMVDVIIGGHTHQAMAHFVGQVAVANAWARGRAFSRVDVSVPPDASAPLGVRLFPPEELCRPGSNPCAPGEYEGEQIVEAPEIAQAIQPWLERATEAKARPLKTRVLTELRPEHDRESALGNLVADLVLAVAKGSDVAIVNGGGLRASLPAGDLTYGALYRVIPFDNRLALVRMTAGELALRLREHFAHDGHGIVSVSGIRVDVRCEKDELVIQLVRNDGRRIRANEELLVATSDFLAGGGDDLLPKRLPAGRVEIAGLPNLRDRIAEHLGKAGKPLGEKLVDPNRPRLVLPKPRPVACGGS